MFSKVLKSFPRKPSSTLSTKITAGPSSRPATTAAFSTVTENNAYAPWEDSNILLTGCQGQIGVPLVRALCEELGAENVIASDLGD